MAAWTNPFLAPKNHALFTETSKNEWAEPIRAVLCEPLGVDQEDQDGTTRDAAIDEEDGATSVTLLDLIFLLANLEPVLYAYTSKSTADTSSSSRKPPMLGEVVRGLTATPCELDERVVRYIQTLLLPEGANLRNMVLHGFVSERDCFRPFLPNIRAVTKLLGGPVEVPRFVGTSRPLAEVEEVDRAGDFGCGVFWQQAEVAALASAWRAVNPMEFRTWLSTDFLRPGLFSLWSQPAEDPRLASTINALRAHAILQLEYAFFLWQAGQNQNALRLLLPLLENLLRVAFSVANPTARDPAVARPGEYYATLDGHGQRDRHIVVLTSSYFSEDTSCPPGECEEPKNLLVSAMMSSGGGRLRGALHALRDLFLQDGGANLRARVFHADGCVATQEETDACFLVYLYLSGGRRSEDRRGVRGECGGQKNRAENYMPLLEQTVSHQNGVDLVATGPFEGIRLPTPSGEDCTPFDTLLSQYAPRCHPVSFFIGQLRRLAEEARVVDHLHKKCLHTPYLVKVLEENDPGLDLSQRVQKCDILLMDLRAGSAIHEERRGTSCDEEDQHKIKKPSISAARAGGVVLDLEAGAKNLEKILQTQAEVSTPESLPVLTKTAENVADQLSALNGLMEKRINAAIEFGCLSSSHRKQLGNAMCCFSQFVIGHLAGVIVAERACGVVVQHCCGRGGGPNGGPTGGGGDHLRGGGKNGGPWYRVAAVVGSMDFEKKAPDALRVFEEFLRTKAAKAVFGR